MVRVLATDFMLSDAAMDASYEAIALVEALIEVQHQPRWQRALLSVDSWPSVRGKLAADLGWPAETERSGLGDLPGWAPCSPDHERWGQCGGAEVR